MRRATESSAGEVAGRSQLEDCLLAVLGDRHVHNEVVRSIHAGVHLEREDEVCRFARP